MKLKLATYNLSIKAVKRNPDKVVSDLKFLMSKYHVLGLQEAGAARKLIERAATEIGAKVWFGDGSPGQASTPIMYRGDLDIRGQGAHFLTGPVKLGRRGAGPNVAKTKWLMYIKFKFDGRTVWFGNMHAVPSQYLPNRRLLAKIQFAAAAAFLSSKRGLKFLAGDLNQKPTSPLMEAFTNLRFVSSQVLHGLKATMGKRPIDDIYAFLAPRRLTIIRTRTHKLTSDHYAYGVVAEIVPSETVVPLPIG